MRSEEDQIYLSHKHAGGLSNAKGNLYEDFYTTFQVASCIANYKSQLDSIVFQTQLEDTFVDDLLIVCPNKNIYHQIKNVKGLTWNTKPSNRSILYDFENQMKDCIERKESFALKLVYSEPNSSVGKYIPDSLREYTKAEYFQYQDDLNSIVLANISFLDVLRNISAKGDKSANDELVIIATVLYGSWKAKGNNKRIALQDIVKGAKEHKHFNLSIFSDKEISDECRKILNRIDGFNYSVKGRMFEWWMGDFSGSFPWNKETETHIIEKSPTTRKELVSLL